MHPFVHISIFFLLSNPNQERPFFTQSNKDKDNSVMSKGILKKIKLNFVVIDHITFPKSCEL